MSLDSSIRQPRVIVLCFDGTSNQYNSKVSLYAGHDITARSQHTVQNTNVVKFYALLDKCRPFDQIVYYQVRCHSSLCLAFSLTQAFVGTARYRYIHQSRSRESAVGVVSQDRGSSNGLVPHLSRMVFDPPTHTTLLGISTHTSALDTNLSCRTTGRVTRFVCLVSGAFQVQAPAESFITSLCQVSPAAPTQLAHWQDFCSR